MPSQSQHWTLVDNDLRSDPNCHYFTQQFNVDQRLSFFAIIAEPMPSSAGQTASKAKNTIGAQLAIEATQLAVNDIVEHKLKFTDVFLNLLSKQWKALVLLHSIKNSNKIKIPLIANQINDNGTLNKEQKELISHYDPSVALLYQWNDQLVLLQTGHSQIALLNQRYHSEIKQATHPSLTALLLAADERDDPQNLFQSIDIKHYQLEMTALLPQQYTATKTMARLNANIIKLYRNLELDTEKEQGVDHKKFILLKKQPKQKVSPPPSQPIKNTAVTTKKSVVAYVLSLFALISTVSAYYIWQAPNAKAEPSTLIDTIKKTNQQDTTDITANPTKVLEEKKHRQTKQQIQTEIQQQLDEQASATEKENVRRQQFIEAQAKADKLAKRKADKLAKRKANERAKRKADKLAKLKVDELAKLKVDELAKLKAAKLAKLKADRLEADRLAIEEFDRLETDRLDKLETDKLENDRLAQLKADNQAKAESDRLATKQQLTIDKNQVEEKLRAENNAKQHSINAEKTQTNPPQKKSTTESTASTPQRQQQQNKTQKRVNDHMEKKKQSMMVELERQKQTQSKARNKRQKLNQQSIVNQVVVYTKRFHQHTAQLEQTLKTIKTIDKDEDLATNKQLAHKRELLIGKENNTRKHLNALSSLYIERLKKICNQEKIHPVSYQSSHKIGRITRNIIARHLRHCSRVRLLSTQQVTTLFLQRFK